MFLTIHSSHKHSLPGYGLFVLGNSSLFQLGPNVFLNVLETQQKAENQSPFTKFDIIQLYIYIYIDKSQYTTNL